MRFNLSQKGQYAIQYLGRLPGPQGGIIMKCTMTLTAALLALAASAHSASAQRSSGGTIGCDPGLPSHQVSATQCRLFHKEALYGPSANPYAAAWDQPAPVVRKKVVKTKKVRTTNKSSGGSGY